MTQGHFQLRLGRRSRVEHGIRRRSQWISIALSCLLSLVAPVAAEAQRIGRFADIDIIPSNPTTADIITIRLSGNWPDLCVPGSPTVTIAGQQIRIDTSNPSTFCLFVVTPWQLSTQVGPLADGTYAVTVRHTDSSESSTVIGNASFAVITDRTPPNTTITGGPSGQIAAGGATFTWTGTDNITPTANLAYAFRLAGFEAGFSAFTSATSTSYSGLANGDYTLLVKARDQEGNEDASPAARSFTVVRDVAPVTDVTGSPQVKVQGTLMPVAPGFLLVQGMELITGGGERVAGACGDGRSFSLGANASLFLNGPLCPSPAVGQSLETTSASFLDLTQGEFTFAAGAASVTPVLRTPISQAEVGAGADFSTTYTVGQAVTTVRTGSVTVTNALTGAVQTATAGTAVVTSLPAGVPPDGTVVPALAAAVLPSSRSVQVGSTATAFATIINGGLITALVCEMEPVTDVPATFSFQATDSANAGIAAVTTPVSIGAGVAQNFVIAFTPSAPIAPTEVQLRFKCGGASAGGAEAPLFVGVNTLLLSASPNPVPDIVALAATLGNNGIVDIPGATGTGAFAVATVNVGVAAAITVSADTNEAVLPVIITLCQTDPATSVCLVPPTSSVTTTVAANATPTFAIFVSGTGQVPFDPAANRIFVRFRDSTNVTRGSTSVAVRTQ